MTSITPGSLLNLRTQILQQNSALQKAAGVAGSASPANGIDALLGSTATPGTAGAGGTGAIDFSAALKDAIGKVSDLQSTSSDMQSSYERGETTDIAAVMLAREKASVGFQATLQVRNKLLSAYKDIMSMPV